MSQSKRSHVRARTRWREQAAALIVDCGGIPPWPHGGHANWGTATAAQALKFVLAGSAPFDVARVRAHCERVIVDAERIAADRVVFADWTRDRGMGPENREPGAFVSIEVVADWQHAEEWRSGIPPRGGWPGRLAREYGWEQCSGCEGRGRIEYQPAVEFRLTFQGKPTMMRCVACKGRGRIRKPGITPGFASGPGLARTAQRLLDTLDGRCPWAPGAEAQPSECQNCIGEHATIESASTAVRKMDRDRFATTGTRREPFTVPIHPRAYLLLSTTRAWKDSDDSVLTVLSNIHVARFEVTESASCCQGTGHNLAGVLPEVGPGIAENQNVD